MHFEHSYSWIWDLGGLQGKRVVSYVYTEVSFALKVFTLGIDSGIKGERRDVSRDNQGYCILGMVVL